MRMRPKVCREPAARQREENTVLYSNTIIRFSKEVTQASEGW